MVSRDSREGGLKQLLQARDDSVRARAVSQQVKLLLKTAAETRLAKQKDIQVETGLLPLSWGLELSVSCTQLVSFWTV